MSAVNPNDGKKVKIKYFTVPPSHKGDRKTGWKEKILSSKNWQHWGDISYCGTNLSKWKTTISEIGVKKCEFSEKLRATHIQNLPCMSQIMINKHSRCLVLFRWHNLHFADGIKKRRYTIFYLDYMWLQLSQMKNASNTQRIPLSISATFNLQPTS